MIGNFVLIEVKKLLMKLVGYLNTLQDRAMQKKQFNMNSNWEILLHNTLPTD